MATMRQMSEVVLDAAVGTSAVINGHGVYICGMLYVHSSFDIPKVYRVSNANVDVKFTAEQVVSIGTYIFECEDPNTEEAEIHIKLGRED